MKKWFAVIGDPVAQSLSPFMHEQWFRENGIDAAYIPIAVPRGQIADGIRSLQFLGCSGWNVTVPHKSSVLPTLGHIDSLAEQMGAVNTVSVDRDGELTGYNTDGEGFVRALEETFGRDRKSDEILLIGAGGAARGIALALEQNGYGPFTIANRTVEKAAAVSGMLKQAAAVSLEDISGKLGRFGIIIQTTTVGMSFAKEGTPLGLEGLQPGTAVIDIIYNPLETEFLSEAAKRGAVTANGIGMFVHQGALAFEKWTGVKPDTASMIRRLTQLLEEDHVNK